jgi:hypothetical protein
VRADRLTVATLNVGTSKPWANRGVHCTASRLQLETPLTSRLYLIVATSTLLSASWEGGQVSQSSRQSQSITQRLARAVRCPNHPGAESIHKAPPIGHARQRGQLHSVIIGALGCPCSYQHPSTSKSALPPFSSLTGLACVAQSAGSLHRLSGFIALLRPITCSLEFGPSSQTYNYRTTPSTLATAGSAWEGKDLACYNNHVFGSAGRLAAAAGCRKRCW